MSKSSNGDKQISVTKAIMARMLAMPPKPHDLAGKKALHKLAKKRGSDAPNTSSKDAKK